jgi:hypothetical protein
MTGARVFVALFFVCCDVKLGMKGQKENEKDDDIYVCDWVVIQWYYELGLRLGTTGSSDLQNDPLLVCAGLGLGLGLVKRGFFAYTGPLPFGIVKWGRSFESSRDGSIF